MAPKPSNPSMYQRWTDPDTGNEFQYLGKTVKWKMTKRGNRTPSVTSTTVTTPTVTPIVSTPPSTAPRKLTWTDIYNNPNLTDGADISAGSSLTALFNKYGLTISPTGQVRSATARELFNPVEAGGLGEGNRQLVVGGKVIKGLEDVAGMDTATEEANRAGLSGSVVGDLIALIRRNAARSAAASAASGITGGGYVAGLADIEKSGQQGSWNKFIQDLMSGISGIGTARTTSLTDLLSTDAVTPDTTTPPAATTPPAPTPPASTYSGYNDPTAPTGGALSPGPGGGFMKVIGNVTLERNTNDAQIRQNLRAFLNNPAYKLTAQQKEYINNLIKGRYSGNKKY
jgi:hypothetical protein